LTKFLEGETWVHMVILVRPEYNEFSWYMCLFDGLVLFQAPQSIRKWLRLEVEAAIANVYGYPDAVPGERGT
jgi:hypothetical protein